MESQLRTINDLHIHEICLASVTRMRAFLSMQRKLDPASAIPESTLIFFLTLIIEGSNIVYRPFFFFPRVSSGQHKETSFVSSFRS